MKYRLCAFAAFLAALSTTASAQALLDKKVLSADAAKQMGEACEAFAKANGWKVTVWLIDDTGSSLYMRRMQGAPLLSVEPSRKKAQTALQTGRPSSQYEARARERGEYVGVTMALQLDNFMAPGGLPVISNGQVAGAIGVGGAPSGGDEKCAQAAIDAVMK
jgi:glc operon protein GlcG